MGTGAISAVRMAAFLRAATPEVEIPRAEELARLYVEESAVEGVNHDVAFAQMCLETGFLRFGGLVTPDMHNYCGLGAIGPGQTGERFPDARTGVRAHIQHLQAYAAEGPLKRPLVDPRYRWVKRGSAPTIDQLTGKWATDPDYGRKIRTILERMAEFSTSR